MRILVYTDNHFCQHSSIVRGRGEKYSKRLENQIQSLNWVQRKAEELKCDMIVCLGDFFDKDSLNSEELSALKEICWSTLPKYYLVGNHEISLSNREYSSVNILSLIPNTHIIDTPARIGDNKDYILCVPYMVENHNLPEIARNFGSDRPQIVFSHNDIKGIQYGPYLSEKGFLVEDIENCCELFVNGHLHNEMQFCKNGFNLGNLTGINFSEDAFEYSHMVMLIDTGTKEMQWYENPFAFNFYKIDCVGKDKLYIDACLQHIKENAVVTIKVDEVLAEYARTVFNSKIVERRVLVNYNKVEAEVKTEFIAVDHVKQFREFVLSKLGSTDILMEELTTICKD